MAWKLKKWKGAEAEEEQAPKEGYDISDAATPAEYNAQRAPQEFVEPEPSQAFSASDLAQEASKTPSQGAFATPDLDDGPSVIALGPAEPEASAAHPSFDIEPEIHDDAAAQNAAVHDLDAPFQPTDLSSHVFKGEESDDQDHISQSVSQAHEAVEAYQQAADAHVAEPEPEPIAFSPEPEPVVFAPEPEPAASEPEPIPFEIDTPGQALADLHAKPSLSNEEDAEVIAQRPASPPPAQTSHLDAFAPYQPPADGAAPDFEDALSFTPAASSRLVVKIGPFSATYEIDKPELSIGRPDPKVGNSPDIALEWDDAVSRRHARILRRRDGDYLEDVGSSNGTLLNGQPVAADTPVLLKEGDVITIGERTQISYLR